MFSELRQIITKNKDNSFIIAIELELTKTNFDLDSLKEILLIDILNKSFSQEKLYEILGDTFACDFLKKVLFRNIQYFKTEEFLIVALKINPLIYNQ